MDVLRPGVRVRAVFWPEVVRVLTVESLGALVKVEVVGASGRFYGARWLRPEEVRQLELLPAVGLSFSGQPEAFFLGMEAHRIRLAHQFDPFQAIHVAMVDPLPHQVDAVYFRILRQPRPRILLADDPGAGKTIMAGLVLKELKYRGLAERVLIVVPGHLRDQWLREMKEKFWETFYVVDRSAVNSSWGRNVWLDHAQVLTSLDFAKQEDVLAALAEAQWDLVIVDEAHKFAAYRYGDKLKRTERYRLGELLSRTAQFMLFLTATPHRGDPENFRLLLDLLEPGMFANTDILEQAVQQGETLGVIRRLKEDLKTFDGLPLFPPRYVHTVTYRLSPGEQAFYWALTRYVREQFNLAGERRNVQFALTLLQRRLASSVRAARRSLERRRDRLAQLLKIGQAAARAGAFDEEALEDLPEAERWRIEEELEHLTAARTQPELEQEIRALEHLISMARDLEKAQTETKLNELKRLLDQHAFRTGGEKLLVFTESRDTMEYLAENLRSWGYAVVTLHGGLGLDERIRAEHEFREDAQVMVSTEAGGEGINLQFCSLMVNYDLPWNPNRLEQRMGRIHRYGQRKEVHIYNLVAEDTVEGEILRRLLEKLETIRRAMGSDRVFDVIQEVLAGASLSELIMEAVAGRRTLEEITAEIEGIPDEAAIARVRAAAQEALAFRHIDLAGIVGEERKAKETRLVPEYIEAFFQRACHFLGLPLQQRADGLWRLERVPSSLRQQPPSFQDRYGLVHESYRQFTFYKEQARRAGAEFVAPGHPLLEAVLEEILRKTGEDLRLGAAFEDPTGKLAGHLWFVMASCHDGNGEVALKRLLAVWAPADGSPLRLVSPSVLWDLTPSTTPAPPSAPPDASHVQAFVVENVLPQLLAEVRAERERQAGVRRRYGLRSLEQLILEADARISDLVTRQARGEAVELPLHEAERRKEELQARYQNLQERIRRELSLLPGEMEIVGVALVQPAQEASLGPDPAVERMGMELAMAYERSQGRHPQDVSAENLGYDIKSEGAGEVRYIEVKARAESGPVVLTKNEWIMAHRLGDEYWLYVVTPLATPPKVWLIRNPARIPAKERVQVQYEIAHWDQWASAEEGPVQ